MSGDIGPGSGTAPILEGHIQVSSFFSLMHQWFFLKNSSSKVVSSFECGEKVVSVRHSDDGSILGILAFMY